MRALASAPGADPRAFAREVAWALTALGGVPALVLAGADASVEVSDALAETTGLSPLAIDAAVRPPWRHPALGGCATALGVVAGRGLVLDEARDDVVIARRGRRVAALAAAAALLLAADLGVARWRLARRDAALLQTIHATAAGALPAGARIVAPRAQLEAAAGALARAPARPRASSACSASSRRVCRRPSPSTRSAHRRWRRRPAPRPGHELRDRRRLRARARRSPALRDVAAEESRAAVDERGVEFGLRAAGTRWRGRRRDDGAPRVARRPERARAPARRGALAVAIASLGLAGALAPR
jgi:hypothetical protein